MNPITKQLTLLLLVVLCTSAAATAQMNVGSNQAPDSSAMLQISGNTKGFLPPRMTRDTMLLIRKPAKGLIVFNTTDSALYMRRDTGWVKLLSDGTVSSVSVASANGVSGTVTNPGTTPAISLTLGAITPTSVASSGSITGSNISGINTGDETQTTIKTKLGAASGTSDGYLTTTDWNAFNNKIGDTSALHSQIEQLNSQVASNLSKINTNTSGIATNTTAIANRFDSLRNNAGVLEGRKNGVFVPQFTLPVNGTVTSVAVASANGVSGTVANSTTTPTLSLSLGAITPSSVAASGSVTGSNLSGTNTGDETGATIKSKLGAASSTTDGYLTQTDWNTFNNKANAITVNGIVKGNGSTLSAATAGTDYAPGTAANATGIVKSTNGTGALTTATAADFPILNQNTTGTASNITGVLNATSLPALTGDVTSAAGSAATTISSKAVTNGKMADMAANTLKGNNTGSAAAPIDLTAAQATAMLNTFSSAAKGLVPASNGGTTNFLRADGTFAVPPGTNAGTVTSVSVTSANGVSGTVATSTTTPAISLSLGAITPTSVAASGTVAGSNLSGTNTGDETQTTIKTKLGTASATTDGYLTQADWNTFNNKAAANSTWNLTGNAGTSGATNFIGTTDNISLRFRANNIQNMILDSLGNVGIGTTSPSTQLHVSAAANPLTLNGVQTGTGTDSLLTISSSVVKKIATSSLVTSSNNAWSLVGNNSTTSGSNFLGTINNASLKIRTNNAQMMLLDSLGNVGIGTTPSFSASPNREKLLVDAGTTSSVNVISGKGSLNNYLQLNIQNRSAGTNASTDVVATADNGDETTNFVDLGINSSGNTANYFGGANDAYLYAASQNMLIGTATANKNLLFLTGGGTQSTNERMRIDGSGNVGIGTASPSTRLHVSAASNPLTLSGVQTGTSTTADSLLTITSGLVRKLPMSTISTLSGGWTITGNSNTNSGTNFLGTTNNASLKIRTNNTQQMIIDSLGNVGIGTSTFSSLNEKLLVDAGTTPYNGPYLGTTPISAVGSSNGFQEILVQNRSYGQNSSSDLVAMGDGTRAGTVAHSTDNFYIDFGINGSGYSTNNSNILNQPNTPYIYSTSPQHLYFGNGYTGKDIIFFTNYGALNGGASADGYEVMRITGGTNPASQQVTIGTPTPNGTNKFTVSGGSYLGGNTTVAGAVLPSLDNNNIHTLGSSSLRWYTVYSTNGTIQTSDRRLKTNIKSLNYGLKEVLAMEPVSYNWKDASQPQNKVGLIAQDVKKLVPEVVIGDETKENLGMNYAELVPVLINAIKEQQKQIDELKKKVESLTK